MNHWQRAYHVFPALAALVTFFTFLPALENDWVNWDDPANFLDNQAYRGLGPAQLKWMWSVRPDASWSDHYIPLSWMTLGMDYKLWGMNARGYHLTSVLLHTANAVLFYLLAAWFLGLTIPGASEFGVRLGALAAALLFALHPLRVESVAWITERRDVLSGFFYLLAILAYVHAYDPRRPARPKLFWTSLVCFALAILSKEIAVTLPAVLLILDVYPLGRLHFAPRRWLEPAMRRVWLEKIPFAALGLALIWVMARVSKGKDLDAMAGLDWFSRMAASIYNLAFYLRKTLAPVRLSPFYPFTPHKIDPAAAPLEISLMVVLSLTAVAILLHKKLPPLPAAWIAYVATISPVLGFIAHGPRLSNDRNTYVACLAWALLAGAGVTLWWTRRARLRWMAPAAAALAVVTLAVLTRLQIPVWHDSDALWSQALAVEPSFIAYNNMGQVLTTRGDDLWAAEHFRKAIALRPDFSTAHLGLAGCLLKLRRPEEAAREYRIALSFGKDPELAYNGLACALAMEGNLDEAIRNFERALKARPGYEDARRNLAQVVARKNSAAAKH